MDIEVKDIVRNYYTGERWFLVNLGKGEKYISESKYKKLNRK